MAEEEEEDDDIPEGFVRFEVDANDIASAMAEVSVQVKYRIPSKSI